VLTKLPRGDNDANPPSEPFDPALLKAVVGGDFLIARELIEDFVPSARADAAIIHRSAADSLMEEVRAASHKLKGSAALIGARDLIALCMQLQLAAVGGERSQVATLAAQLDMRLQEVEAALGTFLECASWR
jgi:HPt (histidine-containing phosphotransfer) domain-containing protein